jgi:signal peptidase I
MGTVRSKAATEGSAMRVWLRGNRGFVLFLLLFGVLRTAVADWNPIPSGSMHPGILEGDVVFVNRLAYNVKIPLTDLVLAHTGEPRRGDIVTFSSPADGRRLIKRIVALPGDTVQMQARRLVINGQPAQYRVEGRVSETDAAGRPWVGLTVQEAIGSASHEIEWAQDRRSAADFGTIRIPADHYLVLGDNRDNSADSRFFGLVGRQLLIGRAERILVSADMLDHWQPRLSRFWAALQ